MCTQSPAANTAGTFVAGDEALVGETRFNPGGAVAMASVLYLGLSIVLGLVEPQSSGLGGGAFLTWYDAGSRTVTTFDARETAPAAAKPDLFMAPGGTPMGFFDAVVGGRSVGVPGVPRLLELVHKRYGKRPWPELFSAARESRPGLCMR